MTQHQYGGKSDKKFVGIMIMRKYPTWKRKLVTNTFLLGNQQF